MKLVWRALELPRKPAQPGPVDPRSAAWPGPRSRPAGPGASLGPVRSRRPAQRLLLAALLIAVAGPVGGCKNRKNAQSLSTAELVPPKNAPAWEARFAVAFDDGYTPTALNMQGRAPNDVLDQQLFQARLGHAAIVVLARVEQVWGRGRYQGRQDQFLEIEVAELLLGTLPKDTPERLMLEVASIDELPGSLKGNDVLVFLRWDKEAEPPFHHHLMPADDELVALIKAMVKHAQEEGVLDAKGEASAGQARKRKRQRRKDRKRRGRDQEPERELLPDAPSGGVAPVDVTTSDSAQPVAPDDPPPADGPRPDASTGLDQLGGQTGSETDSETGGDSDAPSESTDAAPGEGEQPGSSDANGGDPD